MTSVLSSTRQIPLATTFYSFPSAFSNSSLYELTPPANGSGNYPGTMAVAVASPTITGLIARDMGKTVKFSGSFYREVQLLQPNPVVTPDQAGVIGGGLTSYGIYYVVVPISGFSSALALAGLVPLAGGQM